MSPLRLGLIAAGLVTLVLTVGFLDETSWAIDLWPWPVSRLSYIFIASILAAIALPVLWIGVSGELAAMQAGAIDLAVTYAGFTAYLVTLVGDPGQPALGAYVAVFALALIAMLITFARTRGIAWRDQRPMPGPVRASFAVFAVMLVATGTAIAFHADIFPWELTDEASVMFGFIYLGAAAYFVWGYLHPAWPNAQGQLVGFLAYDLVLIGPFADQFGDVSGGRLTSLIVYTAFVLYSGGLAGYYLFVSPDTRWGRERDLPERA
jgi:hypothetical protein